MPETELDRPLLTSRTVMYAIQDIKAGQEVFTSYLPLVVLQMPKHVRDEQLFRGAWFGKEGCRCKKCKSGR
jgi:hypothetical protein